MELRLQVRTRTTDVIPVRVTCDPDTTVGALAVALARRHPGLDLPAGVPTLAVGQDGVLHQLPPATWVSEAGIRSGETPSAMRQTPSSGTITRPACAGIANKRNRIRANKANPPWNILSVLSERSSVFRVSVRVGGFGVEWKQQTE